MNKATYLGPSAMESPVGDARHYHLDPPLTDRESWDDEPTKTWEYVVVSAVAAAPDPWTGTRSETYIFGADADGNVVHWTDLPGSLNNTYDHAEALRKAGYEITPDESSS